MTTQKAATKKANHEEGAQKDSATGRNVLTMKNRDSQLLRRWWIWSGAVAAVVLMNSAISWSQDANSDAKTADAPAAAAKADEKPDTAAADAKPAESPAAPATGEADAKPADAAPGATAPGTVSEAPASAAGAGEARSEASSPMPAGKSQESLVDKAAKAAGANPADVKKSGFSPLVIFLILVALFVLPILIGNYLAQLWRMPDHAWKFALTLGVLAGSIVVVTLGQFKFGPDLAGGITLVYELQDAPTVVANQNSQQGSKSAAGEQVIKSGGRELTMDKLIGGLKKRLDPDGTKEISIRPYGSGAVEIIIPEVSEDEMDFVKDKITKLGQLEFRITADADITKDKPIIEQALLLKPNEKLVMQGDEAIAKWVPYDTTEFGMPGSPNDPMVKRMAGDTPEALVLIDPYTVTGDDLASTSKGIDQRTGGPAVHFTFKSAGSSKFERLTGSNLPNEATRNKQRRLGILLDNRLVNAPNIESRISGSGQISGGSMTDREVELTVQVLDAGSLPAALNKTPISQEIISPTLGGETVEQGKRAIIASLAGVILFMVVYYRFAGMIACIALVLNLLMVLALMVLIKAALTLPGIAGLALSVGMSVDTNVLIYERIREELASGAALRMAIRNGFDRAMSAIIDTHLTTIISGIVLFYVGTDQVKGFAVTLILGIVTNLFTAFFCTRLMFDVAERLGMIKNLKMMHIFTNPHFDFLKFRWVALGLSWALIAIGMVAVYMRGSQLLDIDFTGGSSVTFTLNDKDKTDLSSVRKALDKTDLRDKNLLIVGLGKAGTAYTVDTSEQSVDIVKDVLIKEFGDKLKKYTVDVKEIKPVNDAEFTGVETTVAVNTGPEYHSEQGISHDALREQINDALQQKGVTGAGITLTNPKYNPGSSARLTEWTVRLTGVDEAGAKAALEQLESKLEGTPLFPMANTIGGRVSSDMQFQAFLAVAISLVAMIIYLWFRFQKPTYGLAAGIALIHDVLMTIGMIALSYYIVNAAPGLAAALKIDAFQINLTIVAALLTIIGYSVNDTIVTFDRLREIKGKSPKLTANMVNEAVNQTLGRTILTVFTVFIVVVILYFYGGDGLHSFAFAFLVGVVVGTYSSIYVASPALLWLSGVSAKTTQPESPAPSTRGMQPVS